MDEELETFKTAINLSEYAASWGFGIDKKASSRASIAMRHPNGDKIVIKRNANGHWIYATAIGNLGQGSIIDFLQHWRRCSLGAVRQALRPWIGQGEAPPRPAQGSFASEVVPSSANRLAVMAAFERMEAVSRHAYLEGERAIPAGVLSSPRFAGSIHRDARGNAVFAHRDRDGVCGYEIKNRRFTGFAKAGEKGLWVSGCQKGDTALVIAESAIDALSYAALHPDETARYASVGGRMNPRQPALIRAAIERLPQEGSVIAATDHDPPGRELAKEIEAIAREAGRSFRAHEPEREGDDWNEVLKAVRAPGLPFDP